MSRPKSYATIVYSEEGQGKVANIPIGLVRRLSEYGDEYERKGVLVTTLERFLKLTENFLDKSLPSNCKLVGTYRVWFRDTSNSLDESQAPE